MDVLYTAPKAKSFLLATLSQIDACFVEISEVIKGLKPYILETNIPECTKDYASIVTSMERFEKIFSQVMTGPINPETDPELLRTYRHDLRSAISTIMGFGELIQESLAENEQQGVEGFSVIQDLCRFMLPLIEKVRVDEKPQDFREPEDDASLYCAITFPGHILIIDDDPQKCQVLSRRLEQSGHRVDVCPDGKSGLRFLENDVVDLILLDMLMPGMDGYEVLLELKKNRLTADVPILIISSVSDMGNVVRCIRAGADDYLPMPVDTTLLNARINSCLTRKLLRDREQEAIKRLQEAQDRLNAAIESIDEGFAVFDEQDVLISCNARFLEMYPATQKLGKRGFTYEQFLRTNLEHGTFLLQRRGVHGDDPEDWIQQHLSYHHSPGRPHAVLLSSKKWVEILEKPTPDGGIVAVHKDISEGKQKEETLEFLATHDPLTGLANRTLYEEYLNEILGQSLKDKSLFAVVFFDLDGFKQVNDTLGHDFGDQVLNYVAIQLTHALRDRDLLARIGGDEFAAVLTDFDTVSNLESIVKRCLDAVGTSLTLNDKTASFGVSIGYAVYPTHGQDKDTLLKKADEAMYAAKKAGKGTYRIAV